MTSRERVLTALDHRQPDRPPRLLYDEVAGYAPPVARLLAEKCGPLTAREHFRMDAAGIRAGPTRLARERFLPWLGARGPAALASGQLDEWGVWWRQGDLQDFDHMEAPLRDVGDPARIREYPWPDLGEDYRYAGLKEQVDRLHADGLAVAACPPTIFEQAWYLRGMEELMMDMGAEPEAALCILERTAGLQRASAERLARAGVDIIVAGDDVAGPRGLLMAVGMWRDYLKPLQAATFAAVRRANPSTRILYRSDGDVTALIPDLLEMGIDILGPLQPECLDPAALKAEYGTRLSFWGGVSAQRVLALGSPQEVRAEVAGRIAALGSGGRYILAPAHVLDPVTPWENIVAFFEAADGTP